MTSVCSCVASPLPGVNGTFILWPAFLAAFSIPTDSMLQYTLAFFWLMAFSSSTHDIAADGFYMLGLSNHDQSWFIGIRNSFYRLAILFSQGILVILAGQLEDFYGNVKIAWASIFGILSILFLFLAFYHRWALPLPQNDKNSQKDIGTENDNINLI